MSLRTKGGLPRFWCRENSGEGHAGTRVFKIVGTLPVKTRLPLVAWVLAGCNAVLASDLANTGQRPSDTGSEAGNGSLCLND